MIEKLFDYEGTFKTAHDLKYHWSDESTSFDCPCGTTEILLAEGGDTVRCKCGKVYRLICYVAVDDAMVMIEER